AKRGPTCSRIHGDEPGRARGESRRALRPTKILDQLHRRRQLFQIFPKPVRLITSKEARRQDRGAFERVNGAADIVQAGRSEPLIEFDHVVTGADVGRVVRVQRLAEKTVYRSERVQWIGAKALVANEQQTVRLRTRDCLAQGV